MVETRVQTALSPTYWDEEFSVEFFQNNPFAAYAGTGDNSPIVMKEDFASKRGNGITFDFITQLDRGSLKGYQPLHGHEDEMDEWGDKIYWTERKKGISLHELDMDLAAIDLRKAARGNLRTWADEDVKFEVISAAQYVGANMDQPYSMAATSDINTWQTNNADRIKYAGGTYTAGAHATSLGTITSANGRMTRAFISSIKRQALMARPRITPVSVSKTDNRRRFVAFAHPYCVRDFVTDLNQNESQVRIIEKNENLFLGGDRDWEGVIVHEVDDMPVYSGVGNGGIDVAPVFLFGAEALGWAIKSRYSSREHVGPYKEVLGLGMFGKWGFKKLGYTIGDPTKMATTQSGGTTNILGKQRGIVSGFAACVPD